MKEITYFSRAISSFTLSYFSPTRWSTTFAAQKKFMTSFWDNFGNKKKSVSGSVGAANSGYCTSNTGSGGGGGGGGGVTGTSIACKTRREIDGRIDRPIKPFSLLYRAAQISIQ